MYFVLRDIIDKTMVGLTDQFQRVKKKKEIDDESTGTRPRHQMNQTHIASSMSGEIISHASRLPDDASCPETWPTYSTIRCKI